MTIQRMISATSTLTSTFARRLMMKPSGLGAPQTQRLRLGPYRTNKASFIGASPHHRRSRTASGGPASSPIGSEAARLRGLFTSAAGLRLAGWLIS
jgi:hypothetical protein